LAVQYDHTDEENEFFHVGFVFVEKDGCMKALVLQAFLTLIAGVKLWRKVGRGNRVLYLNDPCFHGVAANFHETTRKVLRGGC
jgi:hypothetical protein